jgi:hypothetical protein
MQVNSTGWADETHTLTSDITIITLASSTTLLEAWATT